MMRYIAAIITLTFALGFTQAHADSFSDSQETYKERRTPVMQYGRYDPSAAPVPQDMKESTNERPCCRAGGPPRWYIGAVGYVVFLKDNEVSFSSSLPLSRNSDKYTTGTGYGFGGNIGYRLTPSLRAEVEVSLRTNDLDKVNGVTPALPNGTYSAQKSTSYMFNGYYDFVNDTSFTPYLGAGIGKAFVKAPIYYYTTTPPQESVFLKGWATAYQFMAGISYEVDTGFNPVVFNLGYRFYDTMDLEENFKSIPFKMTYGNGSHNIELGGKFYF